MSRFRAPIWQTRAAVARQHGSREEAFDGWHHGVSIDRPLPRNLHAEIGKEDEAERVTSAQLMGPRYRSFGSTSPARQSRTSASSVGSAPREPCIMQTRPRCVPSSIAPSPDISPTSESGSNRLDRARFGPFRAAANRGDVVRGAGIGLSAASRRRMPRLGALSSGRALHRGAGDPRPRIDRLRSDREAA